MDLLKQIPGPPGRERSDLSGWTKTRHKLAVDAKGYVWRAYADSWSMAPTNPDNSPIPEPVTYYVPEADLVDEVQAARERDAMLHKRVRAKLTRLDSGDYSTPELVADLERLATHPVWEQSEAAAVEAESLGDEIDRLRDQLAQIATLNVPEIMSRWAKEALAIDVRSKCS
jgi:hypothetical protein